MKTKPVKKKPKQPRRISSQYLENAALYYLQRYATSVENFRRVMTRKINKSCTFHEADPEPFYPVLENMIGRYIAAGLLNDKGFAEAKTSSLRRQGKSKQAIFAKLQAKGLGKIDIAAGLDTADSESGADAEMHAARTHARKKKLGPWRTKTPDDAMKQKQKDLANMARAGFSYDIAQRVIGAAEEEDF